MTATLTEKKVRYHSKETRTFAADLLENLPAYAFEQPGVQKQLAERGVEIPVVGESEPAAVATGRDYSDLIESYLYQIRDARDTLKRSGGDRRVRDECEMKIDQYGAAIDNAKAAAAITDDAANFVSLSGEFSFRVPPKVDGEHTAETRRSMSRCYLATDPLEIAWLRRMTQGGAIQEAALTERVAVPKDGQPPRVVDVKTWFHMLDMGMVNP